MTQERKQHENEQAAHPARFYNMDAVDGCRQHLADGAVDLVVTDPPYGIDGTTLHKHYNRKEDLVVDGYVEVDRKDYPAFTRRWIAEAARILRPGGALFALSGYTNLRHLLAALADSGLLERNHIIWKYNFGVYTRKKFVSSHYHVLYWVKPGPNPTFRQDARFAQPERDPDGRSLLYRDLEDVWIINREYKPGRAKNKNELPTALLVKILQYASRENDLVCDLFLGGFNTARVAVGMNRRIVGFERGRKPFEHGLGIMANVKPGGLLPSLKRPRGQAPRNQGKPWAAEEIRRLRARFLALREEGRTKQDAVASLCEEFGRGRFAVDRILRAEPGGP